MSLYNMIFGRNPASDAILATLGLHRDDVGRFRDCFIANGEIAVYTRNGGGNRECWHEDQKPDGFVGGAKCNGVSRVVEVDEYAITNGQYKPTGRRVNQTEWTCPEPGSAKCACPGCTVNFRLPAHPLYLRDADDDFDCTYCTIYFKFPDEFAAELRLLDSGEKFEPSERWLKAIEAIKAMPVTP